MAFFFSLFGANGRRNQKTETINMCSGPSNPRPTPQGGNYDVFLSFRGPDTRKSFTSFLYQGLKDARVNVYKDDKNLPYGEAIIPSLVETIEKCRVSIPIFSQGYASSKSCLQEIAKIFECMRTREQIVLPIFYDIEPRDVGKQRGPFEQPFRQYQAEGIPPEVINSWKEALEHIAKLKGETVSRYDVQAEVVKKIVSEVMTWMATRELPVDKDLIGMDQPIDAVVEMLQVSSSDIRVVGICGMSGIGKSTLAKAVYNKICGSFESCSFISDIGQGELSSLQNEMILDLRGQRYERPNSVQQIIKYIRYAFVDTRVLIVLDDVQSSKQTDAFGMDRLPFGPGSRIILTTRKPGELQTVRNVKWYPVQPLNLSHSYELFLCHAFGGNLPDQEYHKLSIDIAHNTGGIPLVIKTVGGILSDYKDIGKKGCEEYLQQLKKCDFDKLKTLLEISYETLNDEQKQIYLDIACFLTGENNTIASYMWEDRDFYPIGGIQKLRRMSLVNIGKNDKLLMSDPMRQFGKKLVFRENENPGKRSRVWNHDEALKVLKDKQGPKKVEALLLQFESGRTTTLGKEEFEDLSELKYLRLDRAKMSGDLMNLLQQLRWLDWENCHEISDAVHNLTLDNLVILNMSRSSVTKSWIGWQLMEKAKKLKVLLLAGCNHLTRSPPFPDNLELERLDFEDCLYLGEIIIPPGSIETLVYLNLKGCRDLTMLPPCLGSMTALKELILDGTSIEEINVGSELMILEILSACNCVKLEKISNSIGKLNYLLCLALDNTPIAKLPNSIGSLTKLETLSLRMCTKLLALPSSIGGLISLVKMDLSHTTITELPISVKELKSLQILLMERTFLEKFPEAIPQLKSLRKIDFSLCRCMKGEIADGINSLSSLTTLMLSATDISRVSTNIFELSQLQVLHLWKCKKLQDLPSLPTSVTNLQVEFRNMVNIPNLSHMTNLIELHLADNADEHSDHPTEGQDWPVESFQWIPKLSKLETLELHLSNHELPENFSDFKKLKKLVLSCSRLKCLPQLPSSLVTLHLKNCELLKATDLSSLKSLSSLELHNCDVETIVLENVKELQVLRISDCGKLREISGIRGLSCLRKLTLSKCPHYQKPDLSKLKKKGLEVEEFS